MDLQTPLPVCGYMVGLLSKHVPKGRMILEPTPGIGNLVSTLRHKGYHVAKPKGDYWKMKPRHYDAVVMNPPFTPAHQGYRFLYEAMYRANIVITVMPFDVMLNSIKRTRDLIAYGLVSITLLPRNIFPECGVKCCILELKKRASASTFI